ncbi:16884_t:CDS:2, partial [Dentiscutata erythropus]
MTVPTISTSSSNASAFFQINNILENYNNEPVSEPNYLFDDEFADVVEITEHDDDADTLIYCMDEVEKFISMQFQNAESSEEPTNFAFKIELDPGLLDSVALSQDLETNLLDLERIKNIGLFVKAVDEYKEALQAHKQQ